MVIAPPPLQQLTADLQHSSNERTRMLAEVDDLRQRVELQERRLKEVEGEKEALDTQLRSATGQLKHAREKATESIRRCVCCGGVHVRTYICAYVCKVYSDQCTVSAAHQLNVHTCCVHVHVLPYYVYRLKLQCRHSEEKLVRLSRERDELVVSLS